MGELEHASAIDLSTWQHQWLETRGVNSTSAQLFLGQPSSLSFNLQEDSLDHLLRMHRANVGLYNFDNWSYNFATFAQCKL